ncbi:MAG: hypothetical protein HY320_02500 [Armatimonadetes bacterium]|nr:hypothetical protein [Armatimonadota bacterium]
MRGALIALLIWTGLAGGVALAQGGESAPPPGMVTLQFSGLRPGDWFALADQPEVLSPRPVGAEELPAGQSVAPGRIYYLVAGPRSQPTEALRAMPFYVPIPSQVPTAPILLTLRPGMATFSAEDWRAALGDALPPEEEQKLREFAARFAPPPASPPAPVREPPAPPANVPAPHAQPPAPPPTPAPAPTVSPAELAAVREEVRELRAETERVRQQSTWFGLISLALSLAALIALCFWFFGGWQPHQRALAEFEEDLNRRLASQLSAIADMGRQLDAMRRHLQAPSAASGPDDPAAGGPGAL